MKKVMNLTKGKISKLHKKNKQTRKVLSSNPKKRNDRNSYTFRKKRWIDLSNKTLKHMKITGGSDGDAKLQQHNINNIGAQLEMPEMMTTSTTQENISEELINDLPEEMLEHIVSGSIFEPPNQDSSIIEEEIKPEHLTPLQEQQPQIQQQPQEQVLNLDPFDSVNNVAHIFASSSSTTPLPLPVYGGKNKKKRFRLTKKSK